MYQKGLTTESESSHVSPVKEEGVVSKAEELRSRIVKPEPNTDNRVVRYTDGSVDLNSSIAISAQLHTKDSKADLKIVSHILSQYRSIYKRNPIGVENFEFTASLTGDNPKKVNFIDPSSPALSESNELTDQWGSPIVFHPVSGEIMELRSLGPDRKLWTEDDIELKP